MARILIVEDDAGIRLGLTRNLEFEGHTVLAAADGEEGLRLAVDSSPELIILDIILPGLDGLEICRLIRKHKLTVPILFLSARSEEQDKVEGLRIGGDDYLAKPFSVKELLARVDAMLRRSNMLAGTDEPYAFGPFLLDFSERRLYRHGKPIEITDREFTLLSFLVRNSERALSREAILREVWGFGYDGTARTIDNFITRLRRKLEENPRRPRRIVTVRGHGYRFCATKDEALRKGLR